MKLLFEEAFAADLLCLNSQNHTWIGSVQGAVAPWSNHWSQELTH